MKLLHQTDSTKWAQHLVEIKPIAEGEYIAVAGLHRRCKI